MHQVRHFRRAFTLVELVLSMAVMSILLGGLASAMIIATRAIPNRESALGAAMDSAYATDQLAGELVVAKSFSVRSPTVVEFKVDDRNNDGVDEVIRYEWPGTPGDLLTRKYNSDAAVPVIENVNEFGLQYDISPVETETTPPPGESGETVFFNVTGTTGVIDCAIDDKKWVGQYFKPTLPADATVWKVTRVKLQARIHGGNKGISNIQLQSANASNLPSGTLIDEEKLFENTLENGYLDQEINFANAGGLAPAAGICLVVKWIKDAHSCDIQVFTGTIPFSGTNAVTTTNAGTTWSTQATQSMVVTIYGTYTAPGAPQTTTVNYLTGVRIRLRAGTETSSAAETKVRILNEPEVF